MKIIDACNFHNIKRRRNVGRSFLLGSRGEQVKRRRKIRINHPKLIAPEAAGHWLRGQKEKGLLEG
jgi:hypothetical protein